MAFTVQSETAGSAVKLYLSGELDAAAAGNFRTEDPYQDFAASVPYAVNVQLKVAMKIGDETIPTDLAKIFRLLREENYSGYVVLEYEESENPFERIPPFLKEIRSLAA